MRLLPDNRDHGWAPYVYLVYWGFFFEDPIMSHAGWQKWLATGVGTVIFLFLYFAFYRVTRPWNYIDLATMATVGLIYAPFHYGAACFFIFTAALIPFAVTSEAGAFKLLGVVAGVVSLEYWLLHLPFWYWFWSCPFAMFIGGGNIYFAQRNRANECLRIANQEIEHLAKVAERERIARDLHDVLGHTLSVIILKSELAGKLIEIDPVRAKSEIADVEQTSRAALSEVRSTIRGYRTHSLEAEIRQAKATLETAGVSLKAQESTVSLTPVQESVVALVVREAVTNVVRHAQARNCELRLAPQDGNCVLEIRDDGRGGPQVEGNGLRGMRERIEALGGTFVRETRAGTRLSIQFPLTAAKANGVH